MLCLLCVVLAVVKTKEENEERKAKIAANRKEKEEKGFLDFIQRQQSQFTEALTMTDHHYRTVSAFSPSCISFDAWSLTVQHCWSMFGAEPALR